MELEGNPGSALRESINALDALRACLYDASVEPSRVYHKKVLDQLRRFNDLLSRAAWRLGVLMSDPISRLLADEIFAFLNINGGGDDDQGDDDQGDDEATQQTTQENQQQEGGGDGE